MTQSHWQKHKVAALIDYDMLNKVNISEYNQINRISEF